jgi:protease I
MATKTVPITAIRVGKRHRKDLGDIRSLARSIQEIGLLHPVVVRPDGNGRSAYLEMEQSDAGFRRPISYGEIRAADFDALILTGGHAPGMRVYLGSGVLQSAVADFFAQKKPVGAICHGVLLAARSSFRPGKSVLYGKKTTALTKQMSLSPGG